MNSQLEKSRRAFLRGLGATIALPAFDFMAPSGRAFAAAAGGSGFPIRLGFFFVPNGIHMQDWKPSGRGSNFELPYILDPLAPLKNDFLVLTGLTHDKGRANGDGAGDHARSAGVFITGAQPLKSEGSEIRAGMSADQFAATQIGGQTRFPSLELAIEEGTPYGKCDSGYGCAYSNNISWKDSATPLAKENNPRRVFERLFSSELAGEAEKGRGLRLQQRRSVLDFVLEDAKSLSGRLGRNDQYKLDEYLTSIREIEQRIERLEEPGGRNRELVQSQELPAGIPETFHEHVRLMGDMLVLAFQADVTRVATLMFANAGSNRSYREIGVANGHHELSHHQGDPKKHALIRDINRYHTTQLSYVLQRLKSIKEGDGTLLDNCLIVYGSGISDGNRHNHDDLPVLLAGRGGGSVDPGRHVVYPQETPMCNLLLSVAQRAGVQAERFGDSTGPLRDLQV